MSAIDGTQQRRISPVGVKAAPAGTSPSNSGGILVYFITEDGETDRSLWRFDVASGETARLLSYRRYADRISTAP